MDKESSVVAKVSEVSATLREPEGQPQKRGFKPRWLRLQRRERKLKEAQARALTLRTVVG